MLFCFANDKVYCDSKYLAKITISDNILKDRAYEVARNRGYDGHQKALASMVHNFVDKKTGSGPIATSKVTVSANEQLAEELHNPVTKKFKRGKVYVTYCI